MKAVRFHSYGDSGVLVYEDADRPAAGAGQVVVEVAWRARSTRWTSRSAPGFLQQVFPVTFPHVPNFDVAGVITEVGEGVSGWSAGAAVVALPAADRARGAPPSTRPHPAEVLAAAPRTVDLADAAALPSAGLTAWQSLFDHAGLKAGQTILINGAGGAVAGTPSSWLPGWRPGDGDRRGAQRGPGPFLRRGPGHRLHRHATAGRSGRGPVRRRAEPGADQPRGDRGAGGPDRRRRAFVSATFPDFSDAGRGVRVGPCHPAATPLSSLSWWRGLTLAAADGSWQSGGR